MYCEEKYQILTEPLKHTLYLMEELTITSLIANASIYWKNSRKIFWVNEKLSGKCSTRYFEKLLQKKRAFFKRRYFQKLQMKKDLQKNWYPWKTREIFLDCHKNLWLVFLAKQKTNKKQKTKNKSGVGNLFFGWNWCIFPSSYISGHTSWIPMVYIYLWYWTRS